MTTASYLPHHIASGHLCSLLVILSFCSKIRNILCDTITKFEKPDEQHLCQVQFWYTPESCQQIHTENFSIPVSSNGAETISIPSKWWTKAVNNKTELDSIQLGTSQILATLESPWGLFPNRTWIPCSWWAPVPEFLIQSCWGGALKLACLSSIRWRCWSEDTHFEDSDLTPPCLIFRWGK